MISAKDVYSQQLTKETQDYISIQELNEIKTNREIYRQGRCKREWKHNITTQRKTNVEKHEIVSLLFAC